MQPKDTEHDKPEAVRRIEVESRPTNNGAPMNTVQRTFFKNGKKTIIPKKVSNGQIDTRLS